MNNTLPVYLADDRGIFTQPRYVSFGLRVMSGRYFQIVPLQHDPVLLTVLRTHRRRKDGEVTLWAGEHRLKFMPEIGRLGEGHEFAIYPQDLKVKVHTPTYTHVGGRVAPRHPQDGDVWIGS